MVRPYTHIWQGIGECLWLRFWWLTRWRKTLSWWIAGQNLNFVNYSWLLSKISFSSKFDDGPNQLPQMFLTPVGSSWLKVRTWKAKIKPFGGGCEEVQELSWNPTILKAISRHLINLVEIKGVENTHNLSCWTMLIVETMLRLCWCREVACMCMSPEKCLGQFVQEHGKIVALWRCATENQLSWGGGSNLQLTMGAGYVLWTWPRIKTYRGLDPYRIEQFVDVSYSSRGFCYPRLQNHISSYNHKSYHKISDHIITIISFQFILYRLIAFQFIPYQIKTYHIRTYHVQSLNIITYFFR